ncbi:hypothetical protein [Cupriavidus sp. KK10]|nr:hypothetical protein [Cupriavidus sp. KK10]
MAQTDLAGTDSQGFALVRLFGGGISIGHPLGADHHQGGGIAAI